MFGPAEIFIKLFCQLLPGEKLRILQNKLLNFRLRAAIPIPESEVTVFANEGNYKKLFNEFLFKTEPEKERNQQLLQYSLLTTCLNEASSIEVWLDSVASQQHLPQEVLIVDAGSKDATISEIKKWQKNSKINLPIEIYCLENCNIAEGRNLAARKAKTEIFAFSDVGSELDRFWAKKLLEPFLLLPDLEVSMGWYKIITKSKFQYALSRYLSPKIEQINPRLFLPSARSLAIKKETFFSLAGFPEYLNLAGEDSLFDYYLKSSAKKFAFVPEATAFWHFPETTSKSFKTIFNYARGDAEGGKLFWADYFNVCEQYLKLCLELFLFFVFKYIYQVANFLPCFWISLTVVVFFIFRCCRLIFAYHPGSVFSKEGLNNIRAIMFLTVAQFLGFIRGMFARNEILEKRLVKAKGGHLILFLKEAPVRDGDQENKKLLKSYLDKNYFVTLIFTGYPQQKDVILFQHQFLEIHLRSSFDLEVWKNQYQFLFTKGKKSNFEIVDQVNDSFSWQIVEKLNSRN